MDGSDEQTAKLNALRERLFAPLPHADEVVVEQLTEAERCWCDDMCLHRFLRARDWDLAKAEVW